MVSGGASRAIGRTGLTADLSAEGQGSLEVLFILAIIIILSFVVVGKFFSEQDSVFVRASAREVMVGELEKIDKKYFFVKVESVECPGGEVRVIFFLNPSPVNGTTVDPDINRTIEPKVERLIKETASAKSKIIRIGYNSPANLVCKTSGGATNPFVYP